MFISNNFFGKLEEKLKKKKKDKHMVKKIKDKMQMTDLPTSKAQLVLFIINNFNNCKKLNTFLFFSMYDRLCQDLCSTKFISYFELQ